MWSKQLGDKIRVAMIQNKQADGRRWTQAKMCEVVGINVNVFSRFLNGEGGLPDNKITDIAKQLDASFRIDQEGIDYLINPSGANEY